VIIGVATPSHLRSRLERVLADEPGVEVVDLATTPNVRIAAVHGALPDGTNAEVVVPLPLDPIAHLADLLAGEACRLARASTPASVALTRSGQPLTDGFGVTFPPPIGARWATSDGDRWVATIDGPLVGIAVEATGTAGTARLGVVDHHDFLAAIGLAAPVLAALGDGDELGAARRAGMSTAEFVPD